MNKDLFTGKISWSKLLFYVGVLGLIFAEVLFLVFYAPGQVSQIFSSRGEIDKDAKEIETLSLAIAKIKALDEGELNGYLQAATAALPDEKMTSGVVTGMSTLAGSYGAAVKSLEFSPGLISTNSAALSDLPVLAESSVGSGVKQVTATLNLTVQMPALASFLAGLNKTSQLIGVNQVDFSANKGAANSAEVLLRIYYQPRRSFNIKTAAQNLKLLSDRDISLLEDLSKENVFTVPQE